MQSEKLKMINELARKAKETALNEEELALQKKLREEYIAEYRESLRGTLENTYIQRPDGTREKLKKKESASR